MENLRKNRTKLWISGPALGIWYLWSIMFVCFSQALIDAPAKHAGSLAEQHVFAQILEPSPPGVCNEHVLSEETSHSCEFNGKFVIASDIPLLDIALLRIPWFLLPHKLEKVVLTNQYAILKFPTLRIFLRICAFLK